MYLVNVYSVFKVLGGDVAGGPCDLGTCLGSTLGPTLYTILHPLNSSIFIKIDELFVFIKIFPPKGYELAFLTGYP